MPVRGCDMTALAYPPEPLQHRDHEPSHAVHRRLHDRSQDQSLPWLRPHAAGDRALGPDAGRRTARIDGRTARTDTRGWIATDDGTEDAGVMGAPVRAGGSS